MFNDLIKGLPKQDSFDWKNNINDDKWYKKNATIFGYGDEAKAEVHWLHGELEGKSEFAQGKLEGSVGSAEAHAGFEAGLYVYEKDKNGNMVRKLRPGVSAEAGASVSALSGSAEGRVGLGEDNNMLGVYGKGEAEALSAEAKAKASLTTTEAYVGASAEANLVKAEGSAGVSVLGTDIGVNAGVKVGVGAHAEIGVTDGKLKVDVGAAIGVGVDIGFEVDFSGTVKAIGGAAKSVWDWATGWL